MAVKTAAKKSGPASAVKKTARVCSACGSVLMSNAIYSYREITFTDKSAKSRMRYTCKDHAKRAGDAGSKK